MQVQIRHDEHIDASKNRWIANAVEAALARYGEQITTVEVHLADEDGPKHSDGAIRCSIEVRAAGVPPVAATAHGGDVGVAVDGALDRVERVLDGHLERMRDHRPERGDRVGS